MKKSRPKAATRKPKKKARLKTSGRRNSSASRVAIRAPGALGVETATVTVIIAGASRAAVFNWDGSKKSLTSDGAGNYAVTFPTTRGFHIYSVVVFGNPGDGWAARIQAGSATQNHSGHMSPSGYDTTGDTPFMVA